MNEMLKNISASASGSYNIFSLIIEVDENTKKRKLSYYLS